MVDPDVPADRSSLRAAITTAAAELLDEGGARAVTTRSVAERAGVQAPTIYRLFGDKDGLVRAVAEAMMTSYVTSKQEAPDEGLAPAEALRRGWDRHVGFGLSHPGLYALLSTSGAEELSPVLVAGIDVLRGLVRALAAVGELVVEEDRAVQMLHAAGSGAVAALLEQPPARRDPGLSAALFDAVLAAISSGHGTGTGPDRGVRAQTLQFRTVVDELPALSAAEKSLLGEWLSRAAGHPPQDQS